MNRVVEIGRWTNNLELRYAPESALAIAEGTLAVDRKVAKGKEKEADFITIVLFGATAENTVKYCGKRGDLIAIFGHLQSGKYEKNGTIHYTTKVIADETQWLNFGKSNTEKLANNAEYEAEMTPVEDDGSIPF